jgi:hypothetical protein
VSGYQILFQFIEIYSPLIPLIIFLLKRQKRSGWTILLVSYLVIYISLVYSANHFFSGGNNNIIYIILSGVTFCFFALIFEQFLFSNKFKIFNRTVIIIAVLFFIVNAIWWEGTSIFNSYSSAITNLVLVGYCVFYYKLQLEKPYIIFVEKQPSFWIVSGIFIYSAGNLFLFSVFSSLTRYYPHLAYDAWNINIILILIMNIFFAKGIQCNWLK